MKEKINLIIAANGAGIFLSHHLYSNTLKIWQVLKGVFHLLVLSLGQQMNLEKQSEVKKQKQGSTTIKKARMRIRRIKETEILFVKQNKFSLRTDL